MVVRFIAYNRKISLHSPNGVGKLDFFVFLPFPAGYMAAVYNYIFYSFNGAQVCYMPPAYRAVSYD